MEQSILTVQRESAEGIISRRTGRRPEQQGVVSRTRDSMSDKRQKNQLQMVLAFTGEGRSEAPKARQEGTESLTANCETESGTRQLMEEVCERENLKQPYDE